MPNKIQIKRSISNATVPTLSPGELAFTQNGNNFFIGAPDGSGNFRIGHVINDGVLTANQALVANSTGGINRILTANLEVTRIIANGSPGTAGLQLYSNGTGVYWDVSSFDATKQYTFTNTITFSNTVTFSQTINGTANNALTVGGNTAAQLRDWASAQSAQAYANAQTWVNAQAFVNTSQLSSNLALYQTSAGLAANVVTLTANAANYLNGVGASYYSANVNGGLVQNSSGHFVNANNGIIANSSGVFVNANNGIVSNSSGIFVNVNSSQNISGGLIANATGLFINTAYVASFATNALTVGGNSAGDLNKYAADKAANAYSNATAYADTAAANAYTWAMANTQSRNGSYSGNNTFGGTLTTFNSNVALGVGSYITSDIIPTPNNSLSLGSATNRWKSLYISGSTIYLGNTSLSVDSSNNLVVNGLLANNLVANNAAITTVTSNVTFNSNVTFLASNVNMTNANLHVDFVATQGLSVAGDLYVAGTVTTVDATNLVVNNNLIQLAANNSASDVLDIGIFGEYYTAGSNSYSGFYRLNGSSDTNPIWKLFSSKIKPTTTVTDTNQGTLRAYISPYLGTGGFVANSSAVNITANGVIGVAIVANSMTLTTALNAASGGTGLSSYTAGDILYASGTTALSSLAAGANGTVLQIINNLPAYGTLDAGTF